MNDIGKLIPKRTSQINLIDTRVMRYSIAESIHNSIKDKGSP